MHPEPPCIGSTRTNGVGVKVRPSKSGTGTRRVVLAPASRSAPNARPAGKPGGLRERRVLRPSRPHRRAGPARPTASHTTHKNTTHSPPPPPPPPHAHAHRARTHRTHTLISTRIKLPRPRVPRPRFAEQSAARYDEVDGAQNALEQVGGLARTEWIRLRLRHRFVPNRYELCRAPECVLIKLTLAGAVPGAR